MPQFTRSLLKTFFQKGDTPTEAQFAAMLDSYASLVDDRDLIGLRNYNTAINYVPGDTVLHNGVLYQCLAPTTGIFDPLKWTLLQALGSVIYMGTWSPVNNEPDLSDGTGVKGNYYVCSDSAERDLGSGPIDWQAGDWVIHNGTVYEKVDNTEDQAAIDVAFTPDGDITATNVQDAVVQVRDNTDAKLDDKADLVAGATAGNFAGLDASGNLVDSGFSSASVADKADKVAAAVNGNFAGLDATGNLTDSGMSPATVNAKASKVPTATADNFARFTVSGDIADSNFSATDFLSKENTIEYEPTDEYHPATKGYVDETEANLVTSLGTKADKTVPAAAENLAGLNAAGNLMDSGIAASSVATKVSGATAGNVAGLNASGNPTDSGLAAASLATKVSGATNGNFAGLNASGNITDSGKSPADYLAKNNTDSYTPGADFNPATKKYVDDRVYRLTLPITFDNQYSTSSPSYTRIQLHALVPDPADVFPGATEISVRYVVDYRTTGDASTAGECALYDFSAYTSGTPSPVAGTVMGLTPTDGVWLRRTSVEFSLTTDKSYGLIMHRTAGTGGSSNVEIKACTLILKYS